MSRFVAYTVVGIVLILGTALALGMLILLIVSGGDI